MTYKGHTERGVVVIDGAVNLPDGIAVEIMVIQRKEEPVESEIKQSRSRSLLEKMRPYIGSLNGAPEDGSLNVDKYLYGGSVAGVENVPEK
jgi:hypothetical protein